MPARKIQNRVITILLSTLTLLCTASAAGSKTGMPQVYKCQNAPNCDAIVNVRKITINGSRARDAPEILTLILHIICYSKNTL